MLMASLFLQHVKEVGITMAHPCTVCPNLNSSLMEQQPTHLQPKAPATATSAILLTRDDTPWPNTVPAQQIYLLPGHD